MSFYLRKSVRVGPFRFNFSNSGIGVSAGIKGLRVGTGPRGNYISVGTGVLRYRATLAPAPSTSIINQPVLHDQVSPPENSVGPMHRIESAAISHMQDSSSSALLDELNSKARRPNYWKWVACLSLVALWYSTKASSPVVFPLVFTAGLAVTIYIALRDIVAKNTVVCYQLDSNNEQAYDSLHHAFTTVSSCRKTWRIGSKGNVHDRKYHAGASALITRTDASFGKGLPPQMKSNVDVPFVKGSELSLYFMPDRILVYSSTEIGAISYQDFQCHHARQRFIEDDGVPGDAEVVDQTWKYVNKKGGPDKRFKNNRQLPIALYEELRFQSTTGLNEVFQLSRHSIGDALHNALHSMKRALAI